jgi:hypothetical protein
VFLMRFLLLLTLAWACTDVLAQTPQPPFSNLRAVPSAAVASAPVAARMLYLICLNNDEDIQSSSVQVAGNLVTLTVRMEPLAIPVFCIGTPPPANYVDFALGSFAEGEYNLVVQPMSSFPNITHPTLTTTFSVGPAPSPIPAISLPATLTLLLALGFGAYWALRARAVQPHHD